MSQQDSIYVGCIIDCPAAREIEALGMSLAKEDDGNTYPYNKCSACGDHKSCGCYNNDKEWLCEDCYEDEEDHPTCDKCHEELTWEDNMHKGFSVSEPSPYAYVCASCSESCCSKK